MNSSQQAEGMEDCKYAGLFAKQVTRQMRSGADAQQLIDRYSGTSPVSKSTRGVVNYVYSFKYAENMSGSRIAALTISKCHSKSFGVVKCEDFP